MTISCLGWNEVQLPRLTGDMLYDTVQKKKPSTGSLDGWGVERSSRLFLSLGSIGWRLFFRSLRMAVSGLMGCWMGISL